MDIPIDNVITLRRQGYSNNQIIEYLQRGGYTYTDIMDALTQADIKGNVDGPTQQTVEQPENPMSYSPSSVVTNMQNQQPNTTQQQGQQYDQGQSQPQQQAQQYVQPSQIQQPQTPSMTEAQLEEKIQETAEAIIDERWDQLEDNIKKIIDWKNTMNVRFEKLEQQFSDIKSNFDKLHESVLGKVGDYDKHIQDVGTEVKALERVFQKILPGFIENVNELSRVSKTIKEATEKTSTRRSTQNKSSE